MAWRVLVPIKQTTTAKSRLQGATRDPADHAELVHAIQLDTLNAILALSAHPQFGGLSVVGEPRPGFPAAIEVLADAGGGLNAALATAAHTLATRFPDDGVMAVVGDLPALRPFDLLAVLDRAAQHPRSFVRDLDGTGTTLLAVAAGHSLTPLFGPDSAQRHAGSGAVELDAAISVRADVDDAADLRRCLELGAGSLTSRLIDLLN
jgi:2-phospho-L-lactate guanylyltransferase